MSKNNKNKLKVTTESEIIHRNIQTHTIKVTGTPKNKLALSKKPKKFIGITGLKEKIKKDDVNKK